MSDNEGRKSSWNDRYESQSNRLQKPESFLIDHISLLKPGSVLDVACGEGRNSVFLSQRGFKVSSLDFSEIALNRLAEVSNENHLNIKISELDLDGYDSFKKLRKFDNIIIVHFKLRNDLLDLIPSLLHRNGIFLYCTFNHHELEIRTFPKEYCLQEGELIDKKWALKLQKYTSFKENNRYLDGYLFKK